ncbi:SRPBCC domain-containing protein [Microbulbifer hainanensis]|uniref:SRPBCC domain-containing protein n=1 Tax=Microbulbifer hainanensis TaxID=2735675 RepID=UPI00186870D6|nr:SRPBCC domain-containing protein [Microbulbifer hainanensis]
MFKMNIDTQTEVNAPAGKVWDLLVSFSAYNDWNPMLKNVQGECRVGEPIRFEVSIGGRKPMLLKARISRNEEGRILSWRGGSALLGGEHYFRIESIDDQRVRLYHGERFWGLLLPMMRKKLSMAKPLYKAVNDALKVQLESTFE